MQLTRQTTDVPLEYPLDIRYGHPFSVTEYPRSNAFFPVPDTAKVSITAIPADDGPRGIYKMAGEDNQMLSGQDTSADVHMGVTSGCPWRRKKR